MKPALAILVLAYSFPVFAQTVSFGAPGCGPAAVKFDVKSEESAPPVPNPGPDKALVFFLQDDARYDGLTRPTTRFGIDGVWVGATHGNSYFYVSVDPGERHLCANWQSHFDAAADDRETAAAHFTAEAGKTYYFAAQDIYPKGAYSALVTLVPLDSDEGRLLINAFAFSTSKAKK
jgi:hypothetical protein